MVDYYSIYDLAYTTLFNDPKGMAANIDSTLLRSYPGANRLVKKQVVKEQSGLDYRWPVNLQGSSAATTFGAYHRPVRTVSSHMGRASMTLKNLRTDFSFDEVEDGMNAGAHEIVDMIKMREQNAMIDLTDLIEGKIWGFADTTDEESPQGFLYYFPYCASQGFVGTVSGSHTTVAGLNPSTYTGWKSFGDVYVAVTKDDLIYRIKNAMTETAFMNPLTNMMVPEFSSEKQQWGLYCNKDTLFEIEDKAADQNDNLGPDVDAMGGRAMIRGTQFTEVPKLSTTSNSFSTRDPVFGVNWGEVQNRVRSGYWMKRKILKDDPAQPLSVSVDVYCIYQLIVHNRRKGGFNIAKAA